MSLHNSKKLFFLIMILAFGNCFGKVNTQLGLQELAIEDYSQSATPVVVVAASESIEGLAVASSPSRTAIDDRAPMTNEVMPRGIQSIEEAKEAFCNAPRNRPNPDFYQAFCDD